jgi:hypothetical protein
MTLQQFGKRLFKNRDLFPEDDMYLAAVDHALDADSVPLLESKKAITLHKGGNPPNEYFQDQPTRSRFVNFLSFLIR